MVFYLGVFLVVELQVWNILFLVLFFRRVLGSWFELFVFYSEVISVGFLVFEDMVFQIFLRDWMRSRFLSLGVRACIFWLGVQFFNFVFQDSYFGDEFKLQIDVALL